jgi:23S rRNA pseudouridine1911/1915/1917 synthase
VNQYKNFNQYEYVCENDTPIMLKQYLKTKYAYSSRLMTRIIREGEMTVNGKPCWSTDEVEKGDVIFIRMPTEHVDLLPVSGPLDILYEDDEILAVNKDPGLVTHPTKSHGGDTLGNIVAAYFLQTDQPAKVRFVSRLDMDTSGVILIAKNKYVQHFLQSHFIVPKMEKYYTAYVHHCPVPYSGTINLPIGLASADSIRREVRSDGKPCMTHYRVLKVYGKKQYAKIKLKLETGRTHQIRVHLSHIGCPIIGDHLYNPIHQDLGIARTALHASELTVTLPKNGRQNITAPLKTDLRALENRLENL